MTVDTIAFGLSFHHLGLAVPGPEVAFAFLAALGYRDGAEAYDPIQNVNLAIRHHALMPDVEVIWPAEGNSPVRRMIKTGNMIYHLCYITGDAAASIAAIERAGFAVLPVGEAAPAALFGGVPVSFHAVDGFGLIELIHGDPREP